MVIRQVEKNGKICAVAESSDMVIRDLPSALDLLAAVRYETEADRVVISKELITDHFFILSTRLAGDILQKFVNYRVRIAIYGDFSGYTSKPLKEFIQESNRGDSVFFTANYEIGRASCRERV